MVRTAHSAQETCPGVAFFLRIGTSLFCEMLSSIIMSCSVSIFAICSAVSVISLVGAKQRHGEPRCRLPFDAVVTPSDPRHCGSSLLHCGLRMRIAVSATSSVPQHCASPPHCRQHTFASWRHFRFCRSSSRCKILSSCDRPPPWSTRNWSAVRVPSSWTCWSWCHRRTWLIVVLIGDERLERGPDIAFCNSAATW